MKVISVVRSRRTVKRTPFAPDYVEQALGRLLKNSLLMLDSDLSASI